MTGRHLLSWMAVAVLAGGCRTNGEGTLDARWASIDSSLGHGTLSVPLRAAWCERLGRLTLLGTRGDTGVGILVRTVTLSPAKANVSDTAAKRSPGASVALRVTAGENLFALSSDSGVVAITSERDNRIAGRFVAWLSRPASGPVLLVGTFAGVSVEPDSVRCESFAAPLAPPPVPPDSGVNYPDGQHLLPEGVRPQAGDRGATERGLPQRPGRPAPHPKLRVRRGATDVPASP